MVGIVCLSLKVSTCSTDLFFADADGTNAEQATPKAPKKEEQRKGCLKSSPTVLHTHNNMLLALCHRGKLRNKKVGGRLKPSSVLFSR